MYIYILSVYLCLNLYILLVYLRILYNLLSVQFFEPKCRMRQYVYFCASKASKLRTLEAELSMYLHPKPSCGRFLMHVLARAHTTCSTLYLYVISTCMYVCIYMYIYIHVISVSNAHPSTRPHHMQHPVPRTHISS